MAGPQWKSYVPPVADPAILAFQRQPPMLGGVVTSTSSVPPSPTTPTVTSNGVISNNHSNHVNNSIREPGRIEKMLHSYGFIQCMEREARLFFHYSEYAGNVDAMKIGDHVEFQMSFDRKTGKPIACAVVKLATPPPPPPTAAEDTDHLHDEHEPVIGKVVIAAKSSNNNVGQVSYEQKGEYFYLPYKLDDVEDSIPLTSEAEVLFRISQDKRAGTLSARHIRLLKPVVSERFQGVVCSMKDTFGFIERADVVKEIFFHYSEFQGDINDLLLGDDVDFSVQTRNGKEVATGICRLAAGSVIFEDVGVERRRGKVQKTLRTAHGRRQSDPLAGRIVYETVNGPIEIQYGDKDQQGDFTLQSGDLVEFNIATDRRDRLHRATNIALIDDTFAVNGEKREGGVVAALRDGFGFILCAERDARMFFHFSEMLNPLKEIKVNEEVEFSVIQDPTSTSRQIAIRIKTVPKGSVDMNTVHPIRLCGSVEKEPSIGRSDVTTVEGDDKPGIIIYDVNGTKQTIPYTSKALQGITDPQLGDQVEFQISESRRNGTKTAVNVRCLTRAVPAKPVAEPRRQQGFVATLKDHFGFIETAAHDKEVFFHFSAFDGEAKDLELGDEVEFMETRKNGKTAAEKLKRLSKGTVSPEDMLPGTLHGRIVRSMRILAPEQDEYAGLVTTITPPDSSEHPQVYEFGITGLADKRDFLQPDDVVTFSVSVVRATGDRRATNIAAQRVTERARVDSIKGQFGFLGYEVEDGKKLFFHMTEVLGGADLAPGDQVEFVVVHNQRNGKFSAVSLRKLAREPPSKRPERLISRLKSCGQEGAPYVIALREPRRPDGTKGFSEVRKVWRPPEVEVFA